MQSDRASNGRNRRRRRRRSFSARKTPPRSGSKSERRRRRRAGSASRRSTVNRRRFCNWRRTRRNPPLARPRRRAQRRRNRTPPALIFLLVAPLDDQRVAFGARFALKLAAPAMGVPGPALRVDGPQPLFVGGTNPQRAFGGFPVAVKACARIRANSLERRETGGHMVGENVVAIGRSGLESAVTLSPVEAKIVARAAQRAWPALHPRRVAPRRLWRRAGPGGDRLREARGSRL